MVSDDLGRNVAGAVGIAAKQPVAVLPLTGDNKAAVVDLTSNAVKFKVDTGVAPFGAVVNAAGTFAYVSNWGGRQPRDGDLTAATGYRPDPDRVVVDARGIASTGTVTRMDLETGQRHAPIAVGLHPTAMVWDEAARGACTSRTAMRIRSR